MIGEAQLSRLVSLLSVGTEEERLPRLMLATRTRLGQRRLLVLLQRAYPIALLFERCAQFKNHLRLFGIEGDRLLKLSDRLVVLVRSSQRLPEKIMDMPIARRQSLGLFQLQQPLSWPAEFFPHRGVCGPP